MGYFCGRPEGLSLITRQDPDLEMKKTQNLESNIKRNNGAGIGLIFKMPKNSEVFKISSVSK